MFATPREHSSRLTRCMRSSWIIALVLLGWRAGAQTAPPAAPATSATSAYVGSETCQTCHEDIYNAFQKSPHKQAWFWGSSTAATRPSSSKTSSCASRRSNSHKTRRKTNGEDMPNLLSIDHCPMRLIGDLARHAFQGTTIAKTVSQTIAMFYGFGEVPIHGALVNS
jgi:hypothetical protein